MYENLVIIIFLEFGLQRKFVLIAVCLEKSWKILVPQICVKMFLANQIAGFLNKLYL